MKTIKLGQFSYKVTWSQEDSECVGLCSEFPSLSFLAKNPVQAIEGIIELVKNVVQDLEKHGEPIPQPIAAKKYTGKFMVRVPPDTHKKLALEAAEQHVSLNRLVSEKLAHSEN